MQEEDRWGGGPHSCCTPSPTLQTAEKETERERERERECKKKVSENDGPEQGHMNVILQGLASELTTQALRRLLHLLRRQRSERKPREPLGSRDSSLRTPHSCRKIGAKRSPGGRHDAERPLELRPRVIHSACRSSDNRAQHRRLQRRR